MCIIVYKEAGTNAKIDYELLENCFDNNPDGAGYAIAYDGKLLLKKGFMAWHDFETSLRKTIKSIPIKEAGIMFHFRITTHGGTNRENTHPFPIGTETLTERKYTNLDACVAMNGICLANGGYKSKVSDTMEAVMEIINPMYDIAGAFWKHDSAKTIFGFLGAKWAILEKDGSITSFGNFHSVGGWTYSNYSYQSYKYDRYTGNLKSYTPTTTYCGTYPYYNSYVDDYDDYDESCAIDGVLVGGMTDDVVYALDLIEYEGKILELSTNKVRTVKLSDDYYIDKDGDLYWYNWNTDDFYLMSDEVVYTD